MLVYLVPTNHAQQVSFLVVVGIWIFLFDPILIDLDMEIYQ